MEAATIIRGGAVLLKEGLKTGCGVKLRDGLIAEVGPNETLSAQAQDTVIEATDQVILPGFINGHNHMYNVFSRGISTDAVVTEFSSFLDDFWWPYIENRITPELAEITTRWASVEMIDSGVTTFFDILEAPNAIPGALEREAQVIREAGLRGILTFEACERMSSENAEAWTEGERGFHPESCRRSSGKGRDEHPYPLYLLQGICAEGPRHGKGAGLQIPYAPL